MLSKDGIPTGEDIKKVMPSEERLSRGPVAIAECFQEIPCNPCTMACVKRAIRVEPDINACPVVDHEACNGCGSCVTRCPGLAIFVLDYTFSETHALVKLPYEYLPRPEQGDMVLGLDRAGEAVGTFRVNKVTGSAKNKTYVVSLEVPKELAMDVRGLRV